MHDDAALKTYHFHYHVILVQFAADLCRQEAVSCLVRTIPRRSVHFPAAFSYLKGGSALHGAAPPG